MTMTTGDVSLIVFCMMVYFFVFMTFFVKVTHVGDRFKLDNSFQSGKVTHNFFGDHKNKPLASNEILVNSKMNKVETNKSVLQPGMWKWKLEAVLFLWKRKQKREKSTASA